MNKNEEINKRILLAYSACLGVAVLLIIFTLLYCIRFGLNTLRPEYIRDVSIDITGLLFCGILIFSLSHDKPWDSQNRALFRLVFTLCLLFHFDAISSFTEGHEQFRTATLIINELYLINETLLLYCFFSYIRKELKLDKHEARVERTICMTALIADTMLDLTNFKTGIVFTVNEAGEYIGTRIQSVTDIAGVLIYIVIWIMILRAKNPSPRERLILSSFQIFPVLALLMGTITGDYFAVHPAYMFAVMLIYINVFAMRGEKLMEQQILLDQQRAQLMISQIQPHFLYNVLTTISNLCVTDPEEAEETTVLFSQYLRTNLDSLRQTAPVPFGTELGHIRTYIELEKKRFGDKINVEMDIQESGFPVPSLGLQPIVENSIKHGIRGKDTPGHLWISSRKVNGGYEVVISDDGVGFDPSAPAKNDGRSHVGMVNVRSRLEQICNATMTVETSPGNGCKTTILFPEME